MLSVCINYGVKIDDIAECMHGLTMTCIETGSLSSTSGTGFSQSLQPLNEEEI